MSRKPRHEEESSEEEEEDELVLKGAKTTDIQEEYTVQAVFGSGGFSTVYTAVDNSNGDVVAIKHIVKYREEPDRMMPWELHKQYLVNEVETLLRLSGCTNVVQLYDIYEDAGNIFMVFELIDGEELFDMICANGYYPEAEAVLILRAVCRGLKACHDRNVMHRDIKPENIMCPITDKNSHDLTKATIIDFGLAAILETGKFATEASGSPGYVAPEILVGCPYDRSVDMWSLGVTAYILLAGYPPWVEDAETPVEDQIIAGDYEFHSPEWDEVSDVAKDWIRKLLVLDPTKRMTVGEALQHPFLKLSVSPADIEVTYTRPETYTQKPATTKERSSHKISEKPKIEPTKSNTPIKTGESKSPMPSRSEPSRSEPGRSEPGRSEPGRSEPGRSEPGRSEPGRSEPGRSEPGRLEPSRTPVHVDPKNATLTTKSQDGKSESKSSEPAKVPSHASHGPSSGVKVESRGGEIKTSEKVSETKVIEIHPSRFEQTKGVEKSGEVKNDDAVVEIEIPIFEIQVETKNVSVHDFSGIPPKARSTPRVTSPRTTVTTLLKPKIFPDESESIDNSTTFQISTPITKTSSRICLKCKKPANITAVFCGSCGAKLDPSASPSPSSPIPHPHISPAPSPLPVQGITPTTKKPKRIYQPPNHITHIPVIREVPTKTSAPPKATYVPPDHTRNIPVLREVYNAYLGKTEIVKQIVAESPSLSQKVKFPKPMEGKTLRSKRGGITDRKEGRLPQSKYLIPVNAPKAELPKYVQPRLPDYRPPDHIHRVPVIREVATPSESSSLPKYVPPDHVHRVPVIREVVRSETPKNESKLPRYVPPDHVNHVPVVKEHPDKILGSNT